MSEPIPFNPADRARHQTKFERTDVGNAERFVARHGENVRWVPAWRCWIIWDEMRWARDETLEVQRLAKETVRSMRHDVAKATERDVKRDLATWMTRSAAKSKLDAMLAVAMSEPGVAITTAQLDADPWKLACQNGVIDLRTGALGPHARTDLITKLVPTHYDIDAECPRWLAFLDRVLAGDAELIGFIQRALGYSLTGLTTERALFFLYGHGRNGKSKFLEVVRALMAGYSNNADFRTFLERKGDGPRNDIARLFGARVVVSNEMGEGKRLSEDVVKSLTGDQEVTVRFLFSEEFDFKPQFKLWLAANHRPVIRGTDEAIWDRVRLIPFTVRITDEEKDDALLEKLVAELPGILAWCVGGCVLWQRDGLGWPSAVRIATDAYRRDSDTLGAFLEDRCEEHDRYQESSTALYESYTDWCKSGGEFQMTLSKFGNSLTERGMHSIKTNGKKFRNGIRLRLDIAPSRTPANSGFLPKSEQRYLDE